MAIVSGAHNNDNNRSKASKQSRGVDQPGILLKATDLATSQFATTRTGMSQGMESYTGMGRQAGRLNDYIGRRRMGE